VNRFTECVTLPLARWYQEVLGQAEDGMLGLDRQKLALLIALLLKNSYSSSLLERHSILWEKKNRNYEDVNLAEEGGLGFKETINKYGFGWLSSKIFDWRNNTFQAGVGDNFPFPLRQVDKLYRVKRQERKAMSNILQDIDHATGRLNSLAKSTEDLATESFIIQRMAMHIIRQYHIDVWTKLFASSYEFKGKDTERQRQKETGRESESLSSSLSSESGSDEEEIYGRPRKRQRYSGRKTAKAVYKSFDEDPPSLTYSSVKAQLKEEPHPTRYGRLYTSGDDIFTLLFLTHLEPNNHLLQIWNKLPHLHALKLLSSRLLTEDFDRVMDEMARLFRSYCLCIPSVSKDRWLVPSAQSNVKPAWIGLTPSPPVTTVVTTRPSLRLQRGRLRV